MKTIAALALSAAVGFALVASIVDAKACGDAECEAAWRSGYLVNAALEPQCGLTLEKTELASAAELAISAPAAWQRGAYDFHAVLIDAGARDACSVGLDAYYGHLPLTVPAAAEDDCLSKGLIAVYAEKGGDGLVCMYR